MDRIQYLLEKMQQESVEMQEGVFYERLELLEEGWELYGYLPAGERYARCFRHVLSNMSVIIQPEELIVGKIPDAIMSAEQERRYEKLCRLPGNNTEPAGFMSYCLDENDGQNSVDASRYAPRWFSAWGHNTMDWGFLLEYGLEGICGIIEDKKSAGGLNEEQVDFYENALIAADGLVTFAARYSEAAAALAEREENPVRKAELFEISRTCGRAVGKPAQSFREALQTVWLVDIALHGVCGARDYSLGRIDQYLWRYYSRDIAEGILDEDKATELLRCMFLKVPEMAGWQSHIYKSKRVMHKNTLVYVILGGVDEHGNDAVNALSFVILKAHALNQLKSPTVFIRYHEQMNEAFLDAAVEVMREGRGDPGFYNDAAVRKTLCSQGLLSEEEARDYCHYACANINLPGRDDELRECFHNYAKYLEYAINAGKSSITDIREVDRVRPPEELVSFDDLLTELRKVLRCEIRRACDMRRESDRKWHESRPFSSESLFLRPCLEAGFDMTSGKSLPCRHMNQHATGIATVGDSLYAIDRLVFREKRFTLKALSQILRRNWKDHALLQAEVTQKFPKFGNGIKEADDYTVLAGRIFCDEIINQSPIKDNGRMIIPSFYSLHWAPTFGNM